MKIAMVASEANPLCKSGGLADVVYSLSRELNKSGEHAIIILPYYKVIKDKNLNPFFLGYHYVNMSWRRQYIGIFRLEIDDIEYYLIDNEYYFNRDGLYGYNDDLERFAYFSLAALEVLKYINFKPDIVHVHDWQGGMIPCLLKEKYNRDDFYKGIHSVLTIHNPAFKGIMDKYFLGDFYGLSDELYDRGTVRFEGNVSTLKSAIVYADMISTVSPTHRNELLSPELSHGLGSVLQLREQDFVGIVNGLDVVEFDPSNDSKIVKAYSKKAFISGKKANKADALASMNLPKNDGPLYGLVSRLTWQKGIDLIIANVAYLVSQGASIAILGSGEHDLENKFQQLRDRFPDRVGIYIGYNDTLAHKIYAGSDFFLMPSLFEPCGIGQIIAQRYGTLPLVRETGGLVDTVIGYNDTNAAIANGFSFRDYDGIALGYAINKSLEVYRNKDLFNQLRKNALELDRSWKVSMNAYLALYKKAVNK
jgi:starch synthase